MKMETTPTFAKQDQPSLSLRLEESLTGRSFDEVLESISELELSPAELKSQLDEGFLEALSAQEDALMMGADTDELAQMYADGVSLLAAYQGSKNKKVFIDDGKKGKLMSVQDYKEQQIVTSLNAAVLNGDDSLVDAIASYSKAAFDLSVVESKSLLGVAGVKLDAVIAGAKNHTRVRGVTAAAAVLIATTAASLASAAPAAADVKAVNVNPTKPSDNEIQKGYAVKVKAKQMQSPAVVPPQPETSPKTETDDGAKEKSVQSDEPTISTVTIIENKDEPKKSIVNVSKKGVVSPEAPVITKADDKDEKKGSVIRIKPIPVVPAPAPAPAPEVAPAPPAAAPAPEAPAPEHIIDPALAGETMWSPEHLTFLRDNLDMYLTIEKETGVEWEIMAALHYREASLAMVNPANEQGIFQLFSLPRAFPAGPISKEEFIRQGVLAANFLKEKSKIGVVDGDLSLGDPNEVKDTLFSYNGRAKSYADQAAELGFSLPAEGSPYVMNLADDKRNSIKNPRWGQYLFDNATQKSPANQAPGAWPLIEGLMKINKISHDRLAEQVAQQATEAKAAADAKAAEENAKKMETVSQPKTELAPVTALHLPVPEGSPTSPQYAGHKGIDFAVPAGTPFYAAMGGTVEVRKFDVTNEQFCKDAFANLGRSVSEIKPEDRVQLEVRITRIIDGRKYVTIYAHMDRIDVEDGQIVEAGHQIGLTGNTGCSTGDHAHFEMQVDDMGSVAPHLLFDGEKWKASGAIVPWSIDIKPQSVDSDGSQSNEDGPHDTFCGCGNHTNSNSAAEVNRSDQLASESGAQNSLELSSYEQDDLGNHPGETILPDTEVAKLSAQEHDLDVVNQILARLNSRQTQEAAEAGRILQSTLQASKK